MLQHFAFLSFLYMAWSVSPYSLGTVSVQFSSAPFSLVQLPSSHSFTSVQLGLFQFSSAQPKRTGSKCWHEFYGNCLQHSVSSCVQSGSSWLLHACLPKVFLAVKYYLLIEKDKRMLFNCHIIMFISQSFLWSKFQHGISWLLSKISHLPKFCLVIKNAE